MTNNILSQLENELDTSPFYIWDYIREHNTHKYITKDEFHQSIIDKGKKYLKNSRADSAYEEEVNFDTFDKYNDDKEKSKIFLMDYDNFNGILKKYESLDTQYKNTIIESIKKNFPTSYNIKKFRNIFFNEIDNRKILDPELRDKIEQDIFAKSNIIDLDFLSRITYFRPEDQKTSSFKKDPYPSRFFSPHFFIERNSMQKVDKYFIYFNTHNIDLRDNERPKNFDKSLIELTKNQINLETIGSIKIENEKMVFFHYNFLNKVLEDKEELFFECNNGEFSIKKYVDDVHKENLEKFSILTEQLEKIDYFNHFVNHNSTNPSYSTLTNQKKVAIEAVKIIKKFNFNKNQQCFYFIDFNDQI